MPRGGMHHRSQRVSPEPEIDPVTKANRNLQKAAGQFHEAEAELRELRDVDKNRERIDATFREIEKEVEADALKILAKRNIEEGGYKESITFINGRDWSYLDKIEKLEDIRKIPGTFILIRHHESKATEYKLVPKIFERKIKQLLSFSKDERGKMGIERPWLGSYELDGYEYQIL